MVEDKQVRFVMIGGAGWAGRRLDNEARQRALSDWIRENGKAFDVALWRSLSTREGDPAPDPGTAWTVRNSMTSGRRLVSLRGVAIA
jgi:hypothetical protein